MKIIVDTQKTVGDKFILLNKQELFEYKNNQKNSGLKTYCSQSAGL